MNCVHWQINHSGLKISARYMYMFEDKLKSLLPTWWYRLHYRFDDGMVEVFALYSSFHIAQLQVGLAEPLRLGQAKTVKV